MVEFSCYLNGYEARCWEDLRDEWLEAERSGFDGCWICDNACGPFTGYSHIQTWDPYIHLAAMAAITTRLRLGILVTPVQRRIPGVLAKMTSSLDHVSNGRLNVGIGACDLPNLLEPYGVKFEKGPVRVAQMCEYIDALKLLWTEEAATYQGEFYHLKDAYNNKKPLQKPHPPITIGIYAGRKLMPIAAAKYADSINIINSNDEHACEILDLVESHCQDLGADFKSKKKSRVVQVHISDEDPKIVLGRAIELAVSTLNISREKLSHYENTQERLIIGSTDYIVEQCIKLNDDGFDELIFKVDGGWVSHNRKAVMRTLGTEVLPRVRAARP